MFGGGGRCGSTATALLARRRRVKVGQQDHRARRRTAVIVRGPQSRGAVGFDQPGLQRTQSRSTSCASSSVATRVDPEGSPGSGAMMKSKWSPARRQRGKKQRRRTSPTSRGQPPGTLAVGSTQSGPADVRPVLVDLSKDDDHPTGAPRAAMSAPPGLRDGRGGAPVEDLDVVADARIRAANRIQCHDRGSAPASCLEFAQLRQPRRQMLRDRERRQDPDCHGPPMQLCRPARDPAADRACVTRAERWITAANRRNPANCVRRRIAGLPARLMDVVDVGRRRGALGEHASLIMSAEKPVHCWILDHKHRVTGWPSRAAVSPSRLAVQPARTGRQTPVQR